ncbi:MAG: phosphatase domain-containing putative toxin [Candidatus Xenobia bacterium]
MEIAPVGVRATAARTLRSPFTSPAPLDRTELTLTAPAAPAPPAAVSSWRRMASLALLGTLSLIGLPGLAAAAPPEAAATVSDHHILKPGMLLKADQFPTLHNRHLQDCRTHDVQPLIPGAPNYRKIKGEDIAGVAQPTIDGIRGVLDQLGGRDHRVVWVNLREEPVVYINGTPYNPRQIKQPFANLENPGASSREVERSDEQLKQDVLRQGGHITVMDEDANGQVVEHEIPVENVQTVHEVYDQLKAEGYQVDYHRVPISDEKAPDADDLDALTAIARQAGPDTPMVFNCHAGRGRTTTGMVVSSMVRHAMQGDDESDLPLERRQAIRADIKQQGDFNPKEYRQILNLLKVLQKGPQTQADADHVIQRFSTLANLRDDIKTQRLRTEETGKQSDRERVRDYLKRYFTVLTFDRYVHEQAPQGFQVPYSKWIEQHPELQHVLENVQLALDRPQGFGRKTNWRSQWGLMGTTSPEMEAYTAYA